MRSQGSTVVVIGTLLVFGVIIADIVAHPAGTQVASNAATTFSKQSYNALLGQPS